MVEEINMKIQGIKGKLILKVGDTFIEVTAIKNPDSDIELDWTSYEISQTKDC